MNELYKDGLKNSITVEFNEKSLEENFVMLMKLNNAYADFLSSGNQRKGLFRERNIFSFLFSKM